jgi:NADH-quinone oxidoreductase subunit D/NADH-quinone oxidoreductase subunit C/D
MELTPAGHPHRRATDAAPVYEDYFVNMGPQHPSTHGVLRLVLKLEGETVLGLTPIIGYVHRGVEKMGEAMSVLQFTHLTDRLDYLSAHMNNWGWALAVEQALGIEVPARAEHIRVILSELTRISSHQLWWGVLGMDLGAFTPFLYGFRDRELVNDIFEKTCGARLTMNFIRPGGVTQDVDEDFAKDVRAFVEYFTPVIDEYETLIGGNIIFQERTKGIGVLSADLARSLGCTGPTLRASGVDYDVRRNRPYGIYPQLAFQVPVAAEGDSWARYTVRIAEMRESLKIVRQALDTMPEGPVRTKLPPILKVPAGRWLSRVEAARGEIAFFLVGDGTDKPWRLKVRSPNFSNLAALPEIVKGCRVADVVAVLSTLDVVIPCIDR